MSILRRDFGAMPDGSPVYEYELENRSGLKVNILTLGATLRSIVIKDKTGVERDLLLGFDTVEDYLTRHDYQGVIVGPVANRIAKGELPIGTKTYELVKNEKDKLCLHSNAEYNTANWRALIADADRIEFTYVHPDGANGFPGEIRNTVSYTLTDDGELKIAYHAVSDRDTYLNLTNHAYFNLNGYDGGDVLGHIVRIDSDAITEVDPDSIPTGRLYPVEGTPFDFRAEKPIGRDVNADDPQLLIGGGYDHNFCLRENPDGACREVARVRSAETGINMQVFTDLPGVQFYIGNFLHGQPGKENVPMIKRAGLCLETQFYPDTPHRPEFPTCLFKKGQPFDSETVYRFSVDKENETE